MDVGLTDVVAGDVCVNECVETDAQGRFQLTGYPEREYKIWARGDKKSGDEEIVFRVESDIFTITRALKPLRLMLRPSKD